MPIDIDIAYVARLARIDLSSEELARFGGQLGVILEHAARVQDLPTEDIPPTAHPLAIVNAFRPDDVRPSLEQAVVLGQAPASEDGYFRVPPALET